MDTLPADLIVYIAAHLSWLWRHILRRVSRAIYTILQSRSAVLALGMVPSRPPPRIYSGVADIGLLHISDSPALSGSSIIYGNNHPEWSRTNRLAIWLMTNIVRDATISIGRCNMSILNYITQYDDPDLFWAVRDVLREYGHTRVYANYVGPHLMTSMLAHPECRNIATEYIQNMQIWHMRYEWPDTFMMICRRYIDNVQHNPIAHIVDSEFPLEHINALISMYGYPDDHTAVQHLVGRGILPDGYIRAVLDFATIEQIEEYRARHDIDLTQHAVRRSDILAYVEHFNILHTAPYTALYSAIMSGSTAILSIIYNRELISREHMYTVFTNIGANAIKPQICRWIARRFPYNAPRPYRSAYVLCMMDILSTPDTMRLTPRTLVPHIHAALGDDRASLMDGRDPRAVADNTLPCTQSSLSSPILTICGYLPADPQDDLISYYISRGIEPDQYRAYLARQT